MNTFKTRLLGLALVGMVLGACSQTATFEDADLMNEQAVEKAGFKLNPLSVGGNENAITLDGGGDYLTDCITEESGDIFKATGDLSTQFGNPNNPSTKTLYVSVWNTLTTIEYRFTLSSPNANGNNLQYFDEGTNLWVGVGALTVGVPFVVSRPLPADWEAGDVITEQWRQVGGGNPLDAGDVSYALIGECSDCEESFSYDVNGNDVTFTYVPAEDVSGANLVFTFPQDALDNGPLQGWSYAGQTMQTTMDLEACKTYTWTVTLTCKPLNNPQNKWTDFKVNNVSKKGTLANIPC